MSSTTSGSQGLGTKTARTSLSELESMVSESPTSDRACGKLAQILRVRRSEVALLRLEKGSLKFIYPAELRSAGVLPLSGSAVAARTASTRSPLLSNAFMRVKHASLFEAVKIVSPADENERSMEQMPIQKIMSVPVVRPGGEVVGVVQVSRKGLCLLYTSRAAHPGSGERFPAGQRGGPGECATGVDGRTCSGLFQSARKRS